MCHARVARLVVSSSIALGTAVAANALSTVFVPLPPCRIADTRVAGGPIAGATNRIFKVVGVATDFTSQGGSASGCGVPGFSGIVAQVQAIALNVAAANNAGAGFLTAFAGDTTRPLASTLNFSAGTTIANGVIVPVRQTAPEGNDLKVFVNVTSDVFMDVTGYFTDITLIDGAGGGIDADTLDGIDSAALGDITGVTAGTGLTGGATSGNATLSVVDSWVNSAGDSMTGALNMQLNLIQNIGDASTDFTSGGGLTVAGSLNALGSTTLGDGAGDAITINGTAAFQRDLTIGDAASDRLTILSTVQGSAALVFEGAAIDTFQTTIAVANPTSDRTITLPNANGTFAVSASTPLVLSVLGDISFGGTPVSVTQGGTGQNGPLTSGGVIWAASSTAMASTAAGTSGQVLTSNGILAPSWTPANAGDITGVTAGTGLTGGATSGNATLNLNLAASNTWTGNTTFDPASGLAFSTGTGDDIDLGGSVKKGGLLFLHNNGTRNLGVGLSALASNATGVDNTAGGNQALSSNTAGSHNTANGSSALFSNTTGSFNTASGSGALAYNTIGDRNTASGLSALFYNTTGVRNTASGVRALTSNTSGFSNTATGVYALRLNTTGVFNTASGDSALKNNTTGGNNTADGEGALLYNTTGSNNTASGNGALAYNTTGFFNTASGGQALVSNTTGYFNTASGGRALAYNTTGSRNIVLGYKAGYSLTTGSDNIDIGNLGIAAESATIRIGTSGTQTATFIAGIRGATTGAADAVAVLIDSNGQLGTVSSSRRYKEEIRDMGSLSERVLKLRPVTFRYKKEVQKGERPVEFGLIAEEVAEVFPELVVYGKDGKPQTVKYHVLAPLLLNELQKQELQVEERERALEVQLARQRQNFDDRLSALLERLAALESRGGPQPPGAVQAAASPR